MNKHKIEVSTKDLLFIKDCIKDSQKDLEGIKSRNYMECLRDSIEECARIIKCIESILKDKS